MLNRRVATIIDQYWDGNVKLAAKELVIPQNTLYRIASGETPNPRVQVLAKIARYCGTTVEWLLSGRGVAPAATTDSGVPISHNYLRWVRLVDSLKLTARTAALFKDLVHGPSHLTMMMWRHEGSEESGSPPIPARGASHLCAGAWADILEVVIRRYGARAVRRAFEDQRVAAACGFSGFGMLLGEDVRQLPVRSALDSYMKGQEEWEARVRAVQRQRAKGIEPWGARVETMQRQRAKAAPPRRK